MHGSRCFCTTAAAFATVLTTANAAMADGERLFFEISNDLSPTQPSAVVTLWATHDPRDYAVAAIFGDLEASEGRWFDIAIIPPMRGPGATPGTVVDGRRVEGFIAWQLQSSTAGIFADPSNPIAVWRGEIEVDVFTPRLIDLASMVTRFDAYRFKFEMYTESRLSTLEQAAGTIHVVPAPASGALLLMGVLTCPRRRRSAGWPRP